MSIDYEKILKRGDGSRVKIKVRFYTDYSNHHEYGVEVYTCKKRKRTWIEACDIDSYEYLVLGWKERDVVRMRDYLKVVTKAEIQEAKICLWEKLKPEKI